MKIPSRNVNNLGIEKNGNLISMEKLSNEMDNANVSQQNNNIISNINNNYQNNNLFPNDLLKSQNDDLNLSNINIEQTQKFVQNADFLFPEEESVNQNNESNKNINLNINNSNDKDISKDDVSQSISEEKRIEYANNLFGNSLSFSMKSKVSNDYSQSLVSEKRKEVADELFRTISNSSSKKKSMNETLKTNKTNISFVVNNLSGSNIGLNINEIANKYADKDKIMDEIEGQPSVAASSGRRNDENNNKKQSIKNSIKKSIKESIKESMNEYDKDIDEDDKISFKKNLIEFKSKSHIDVNESNLKIIHKINSNRKKDNYLIRNSNKNDLVSNSNQININNNINMIDNENNNKNNFDKEKNTKKDNNIINNSNSEINLSNIDFENLPKFNNDKNTDKKINLENKIRAENYTKSNNELKRPNFAELFKKSKKKNNLKKNEEKKRGMIDKDYSDDEVSNDILNKKIKLTDENNESSIFNNNKIPSRISIDDDHSIIKDKNDDKSKKIELKKEKNISINNEEEKHMESKYKFKEIKKNEIDNAKRSQKYMFEENDDNSFANENKIFVYFDDKDLNKEKRFKAFLNENSLYFNEHIHDKEENNIQLKEIKENNYFENYICKQETVIDYINKKKKKMEIPFYYNRIKSSYEENKNNFNSLFQFVTEIDKKKLYDSHKKNKFLNISDYKISPYINSIDDNFKGKVDYIRYTIDENYGDTFYRSFMFNLIENYILNKKIDNLCILIFDLFKLYDLAPSIFNSNRGSDILTSLIFFSFLYDYIHLNMWEKVYFIYISIYPKIEQVLISYIKYSIFLFMSQLYNENNYDNKYLYQYQKILVNYNEPTHLIFQIIPFIFGINLEIIYFKYKKENQLEAQNFVFNPPKSIDKNSNNTIYIIFQYNCYHIGYQKSNFDNNKEVLKFVLENLNKTSLIHYIQKGEIFCEKCDKNTEYIEINKDDNKGICLECLNSKIDEYLVKRISFINQDYKKNYINYSYYLRPIELFLKKPENSIVIKNFDYYSLNYKTFGQRISELFPSSNESIDKVNNINLSFDNDKDNDNDNNACSICQKESNILTSECGCKLCEDCLYEIFLSITNNLIILNGYEKSQLSNNNNDKCPLCEKSLNLNYLVMLFEGKGRNFEFEYNEAKIRMKNCCKTTCFDCLKKFSNEKSLEVSHNSQKLILQIKVMINKHCFKDSRRNNPDGIEELYEIDYSDVDHVVCLECYKRNRNKKIKRINDIEYKVIFCNICGIRHYSNMKEWDKWDKNDICCKCNIY